MKVTAYRLIAAAMLAALAAAPFLMRPDPGQVTGGIARQHGAALASQLRAAAPWGHVAPADFSDLPQ